QEALYAVQLCHELVPEMKIRYVNVSELTALCLGDYCKHQGKCMDKRGVEKFFTKNKPVVFSYHGYVNDIEQILWPYVDSDRFSIHGYREEGTTTTPFDMKVANKVSFYHLAIDMIEQVAKTDKKMARRKPALLKEINKRIRAHQDHICKFGDDPEDVKAMCWGEK
ncbi:phosphoketolase family protein, partial [Candidatus Peregrinibacteria bacterium]|nr:phosphoketolase family protein [Candidatus Peregrinibacteria bacterium]